MSTEDKPSSQNLTGKFLLRMLLGSLFGAGIIVAVILLTKDPTLTLIVFAGCLLVSAYLTWRVGKLGFVTGMLLGPLALCIGVLLLLLVICAGNNFRM